MKIMILECNAQERILISKMLNNYDITYETKITGAINSLGIEHFDFAFVDADFKNGVYDWEELTSFLNSLNIEYSVFSSNGNVGIKNGQKIISIHDICEQVKKEECLIQV